MSASTASQTFCPISKEEIEVASDNWVAIQWKGAKGINDASVKRKDDLVAEAGTKEHKSCRQQYINDKKTLKAMLQRKVVVLCHQREPQDNQVEVLTVKRIAYSVDVQLSCTSDTLAGYGLTKFVETILEVCESRSDDWGLTVNGRIEYYLRDLQAADGLHHHSCNGNFRSFKSVPLEFKNASDAKRRMSGRSKDEDKYEAFQNMCAYLEKNSDEQQLTVTSLSLIMKGYLCNPDSEPYDNYSLKKRL